MKHQINCQIKGCGFCSPSDKFSKAINVPAKESEIIQATEMTLNKYEKTFKDLAKHDRESEGWERDFVNRYSPMFQEIAHLADKGDDMGYGKGLARLELEIIESIRKLLSERDERAARIVESKFHNDDAYADAEDLNIRQGLLYCDAILVETRNEIRSNK